MIRACFLEWMTSVDTLCELLKQLIRTYRNVNRAELLGRISAGDGDFINGVINLLTRSGKEDLRGWYMNDINIYEIMEINEPIICALKLLKEAAK